MKRPKRPCLHCGELFTPTRSDAKFCSREHKNAHRTRAAEAAEADPIGALHKQVDRLATYGTDADIAVARAFLADLIAQSMRDRITGDPS